MKTALPSTNNEIVATLVSIVDEMAHLKNDVKACEQIILDHAEDARVSNKAMNETIISLQFSVSSLQSSMTTVQDTLKPLMEFATNVNAISRFLGLTCKALTWLAAIAVAYVTIVKFVG